MLTLQKKESTPDAATQRLSFSERIWINSRERRRLLFGATEQSLGNKLPKSLHVLVDGGHLWPLAEQVLEPTTRSTAKEQRTKSGKEWSRVAHATISIYTYQKSSFFR